MRHYILENKKHKEVDLMTWAKWFENSENRRVAYSDSSKGWRVSTMFLGIDHSFGIGAELLYETMVFDSGTELDCDPFRYSTYEEAEKGHDEILKRLKDLDEQEKNYLKIIDDGKKKTSEIIGEMKKKFPIWCVWDDKKLDTKFPPPKKKTTRYFLKEQEASGILKDNRVGHIVEEKDACTLRERLFMELAYFEETGLHLDEDKITCCLPVLSNGYVPYVDFSAGSGRVFVSSWGLACAYGRVRFRRAVYLDTSPLIPSLPNALEINGVWYDKRN